MFIDGMMSFNVYVPDFETALEWYTDVLGLDVSQHMGDNACMFHVGDNKFGLYLEGGASPAIVTDASTRASFTFIVTDGPEFYEHLRENEVRFVHDAPQDMGNGTHWFQFYDPAGNILEAIDHVSK